MPYFSLFLVDFYLKISLFIPIFSAFMQELITYSQKGPKFLVPSCEGISLKIGPKATRDTL